MTVESLENSRRGMITSGGTGGRLGCGAVLPIGIGRPGTTARPTDPQAVQRRRGADVIWLYPPAPVVDSARRAALRVTPMGA